MPTRLRRPYPATQTPPTRADRTAAWALAASCLLATVPAQAQPRPNAAWWMPRHEQKLAALRAGPVGLVFYGDSITEEMEDARFGADASDVWQHFYACRQGVNLGFGGDTASNLRWRIDNGEASGFAPRLAIVMIGTNDTRPRLDFDPAAVAAGIVATIDDLHRHLPGAAILVLGIPPNGRPADNQQARATINQSLAAHNWRGDRAQFLPVDAALAPGGTADPSLFVPSRSPFGVVHLSEAGWQRLAAFIEPTVKRLSGVPACGP